MCEVLRVIVGACTSYRPIPHQAFGIFRQIGKCHAFNLLCQNRLRNKTPESLQRHCRTIPARRPTTVPTYASPVSPFQVESLPLRLTASPYSNLLSNCFLSICKPRSLMHWLPLCRHRSAVFAFSTCLRWIMFLVRFEVQPEPPTFAADVVDLWHAHEALPGS